MFAAIFVAVELSDDDVGLDEMASQCGYDVIHPQVIDIAEPVASELQGDACLLLKLTLAVDSLSPEELEELLHQGQIRLSHPSLSSFTPLAILPLPAL